MMVLLSVGMFAAQGGTLSSSPAAPIDPTATVTLTYDGSGTNFDKWTPECFIHTWLAAKSGQTFSKEYTTEWFAAQGDLTSVAENRKMTYAGTAGMYTISMNIQSFFGVSDEDLPKIEKLGVIVCTQWVGDPKDEENNKTEDMFLNVSYSPTSGGGDEPAILKAVSVATTWDFSKLTANTESALYNSSDAGIKLNETTTPSKTDEVIYSEYGAGALTIGDGFDGTSIAFTGEYPIRKNKYCQNGVLHFKAGVAGTIVVKFSDTGSTASATAVKRYLVVNGEQTEYWTSRENTGSEPYAAQLNVTTGAIPVEAGDVTIKGTSAVTVYTVSFEPKAEEPGSTTDSIFFVNVQGWANPTIHLWGGTAAGTEWPGVALTNKLADQINGYDVYKYVADKGAYANCIFNDGQKQNGEQTANLDWTSGKYFYGDKWYAKESIPAPVVPVYSIAGQWDMTGEAWNINAFKVAEDGKTATYEVDLKKGDYLFKIVRVEGETQTWLSVNNGGKVYGLHREWRGVKDVKIKDTDNLQVTADVDGSYLFTWTFANDSIGITFPYNYKYMDVWGVEETTSVAAETKYIDNYALSVKSVYEGTRETNKRTFGIYTFTHAIQVRNGEYPSADNVYGTEDTKTTSTSLVVTAKANVDITIYYHRQSPNSDGTGEENDNKDLKVFDQSAPTVALTGLFKNYGAVNENKHFLAAKTLSLQKGHVYTLSAKGTTIKLCGIKYATDAEPQDDREKREIVLVPGELKTADPAMFLMSWTAGKEGFTTKMSVKEVEGDTLYVAQMPKELDSLIFVRCEHGAASIEWGKNVWNQSTDQKIACDTATFAGWAESMFKLTWCAEEEEPGKLPVVALAGEMNKWTVTDEYLFVPAADEKTASVTIKVAEARTDSFKIVVDGKWLSAFGGDDASYVVKRGWPRAEGVNREENVKNMVIIFDEIGDYTFTWTYASNLLEITYPDKTIPQDAQYFLQNNWEGKEWAWKQAMKQDDGTFKLENVVFGGNGVDYNTAAENNDNKIWVGIDAIRVADGKTLGALDTVTFVLDPAKNILTATILGKYQKPEVPEVTLYFVNKDEWSAVKAYVWKGEGDQAESYKAWDDSESATETAQTANDHKVYSYTFPNIYTNIIFHNGEGQKTADEVAAWDAAKTYLYDGVWYASLSDIPAEQPAERVFTVVGEKLLVGSEWYLDDASNEMEKQTDGTYQLVKTDVLLGANKYKCKVAINHSFAESYPANDHIVDITEDGYYKLTFTFNDETKVFAVNFEKTGSAVVEKQYTIVGEAAVANGFKWDNSAEQNKMTSADNGVTYKLVVTNASLRVKDYAYKVVEFGSWSEYYPAADGADATFSVTEKAAFTITYTYTVATAKCEVNLTKTGAYVPRLENGYYLVGNFGGVNMWNVDDITADQKLTINTGAEAEEYAITMTLKAGDEFKAVYVEDDEIKSYYPAEGDNCKVTNEQAGEKTIYFRPGGSEEWQGSQFYIAEVAAGLDTLMSNENAVKVMLNGQIYILRGGKTYTVQGQLVK